jgi:hypothetical protein
MDRTQPAVSVEADFLVVDEVSDDEVEVELSDFDESDFDESDFDVSDFEAPLPEFVAECLEPESPLSDVIADDDAPRLSVL